MAYGLVGSVGAVSTGATSAAVTPAWGTGESRTAGNLLVCWVAGEGVATVPTAPSGWTLAKGGTGTSTSSAIFYKIAAGADAAPTIAALTNQLWEVQLGEFSGNAATTLVNQTGSVAGTTSPLTATNAAADAQAGELVAYVATEVYSASATKTNTTALNNGATAQDTNNNAAGVLTHYNLGYGITTGNAAADAVTLTFTTTRITGVAMVVASFNLPAAAATGIPDVNMAAQRAG